MKRRAFTEQDRIEADKASRKLERLILPTFFAQLRRRATTLHKLLLCECNACTRDKFIFESQEIYDRNRIDYQIPWIEERLKVVMNTIDKACKEMDIKYYIQTDPRGSTLWIGSDNDDRYNTEGYCVY